jgi:hypothetical protein
LEYFGLLELGPVERNGQRRRVLAGLAGTLRGISGLICVFEHARHARWSDGRRQGLAADPASVSAAFPRV